MADFIRKFSGEELSRVAFPLGGIGAGMICLEGSGALSHVSVRNRPDVFNEPLMFSALHIRGKRNWSRVLEGPVPEWKVMIDGAGNGGVGKTYGLPRFPGAEFHSRFPFAFVRPIDLDLPLSVELTGWSPFIPGDEDSSSLPVAAIEYRFVNRSSDTIEAIYSFHAANFMATAPKEHCSVRQTEGGFILANPGNPERPQDGGYFCAALDNPETNVNCAWFRGGWFDTLSMLWRSIDRGETPEAAPPADGSPSPGASLSLPFLLEPNEERIVQLRLCWHVANTDLSSGKKTEANGTSDLPESTGGEALPQAHLQWYGGTSGPSELTGGEAVPQTHRPWYAAQFNGVDETNSMWKERYASLHSSSLQFSDSFYSSTLPAEVLEAVSANLSILKSPTLLRQGDGRLWAYEGCYDRDGCCDGSCTHVWNYAQAIPHLFPRLERGLRQTEFGESQDKRGHQSFRATLPILPTNHDFHAAADGQLGGIMKVHRDWRISGETEWLREYWPAVRKSLDYCIETWDPDHRGVLIEPHHNTYDIEFWGADGMCTSIYLGALKAAVLMGKSIGDEVSVYEALYKEGRAYMERDLFNGEYFIQMVQWQGLRADPDFTDSIGSGRKHSPEAIELIQREGPKYQYGDGCLSDGVIGAWLAEVCGVGEILDPEKVESHLLAVYRHNFKRDLSEHANPQRPTYALGAEGGLLLCTWPKGSEPVLPMVYSKEVWTGIEYQVASHLMVTGHVEEGLEIVRACRNRYNGVIRNPYNEFECGHWYARALASYSLIQGITGVAYDRIAKVLTIEPRIDGDFQTFTAVDGGFGIAGVRDGKPFLDVVSGTMEVDTIEYRGWHTS